MRFIWQCYFTEGEAEPRTSKEKAIKEMREFYPLAEVQDDGFVVRFVEGGEVVGRIQRMGLK